MAEADRPRSVWGWLWRPLLIIVATAAVGYWIWTSGPAPGDAASDQARADVPAQVPPPPGPLWSPRPRPALGAGCTPRASTRCIAGDSWWLDSCEQPHEKAQECGLRPCLDDACEPDDAAACGLFTARGVCEDGVARGCVAGRPFEIDCSAKGQRCVMTEDGPACRESGPDDCNVRAGSTRCEGTELQICLEGTVRRIDCAALGGLCGPGRGGGPSRCLLLGPAPSSGDCDACECVGPRGEEVCDGRDNDGDDVIDENAECGEVDIVAFVMVGGGGANFTHEDIEAAVQGVNAAFERDDEYGIRFRLADVVGVEAEEYLQVEDEEIQSLLGSPTIHPEREEFYVPVVFTDQLEVKGVPRPGLATPPNGTCGAVRRTMDPQPVLGAVVVAKRRWPTTLAHEIGHYFGLCHTHAPDAEIPVQLPAGADPEDAQPCGEPCATAGDGICDTPTDPGPPSCLVDPVCGLRCDTGDRPDPSNVMGYYPRCRNMFSRDQALEIRRSLWLRHQWHRCAWQECECGLGGQEPKCPEQMSCHPLSGDFSNGQCVLDGPVVPGGRCEDGLDCGYGSTCMRIGAAPGRCVRPCGPAVDCRCTEVGLGVQVCADDLG